ncbi:MAG: spore coat protein [Alphaproteobacteria bacterium]|nr:spore coat protein [Alphaproteobacteria bacterium]
MAEKIKIGRTTVGEGCPPLFLPDIDVFFDQDMQRAEAMVTKLVGDGVHTIKAAVVHDEEFALDDDTQEKWYSENSVIVSERYRELIARKVNSLNFYDRLFARILELGCDLVLSVYDVAGASFAKQAGAHALKIPSSNITHEVCIRYAAGLGLPLLIDTGKSTLEEIARAVQWARDEGLKDLIIEHSPEAPPSNLSNHHLRMIPSLASLFNCPVGLSDHHAGDEMLYAATALGASVLEMGVCPDDAPPDQDVYHALRISDVAPAMRKCNNIWQALGEPMRYLRRDRSPPTARPGLVAKTMLPAGTLLDENSVDFAFPAHGVGAEHWSLVAGWRLRRDLNPRDIIHWHDIEAVAP